MKKKFSYSFYFLASSNFVSNMEGNAKFIANLLCDIFFYIFYLRGRGGVNKPQKKMCKWEQSSHLHLWKMFKRRYIIRFPYISLLFFSCTWKRTHTHIHLTRRYKFHVAELNWFLLWPMDFSLFFDNCHATVGW